MRLLSKTLTGIREREDKAICAHSSLLVLSNTSLVVTVAADELCSLSLQIDCAAKPQDGANFKVLSQLFL